MSTVREIEAALERLPAEAQREVAAWLDARLGPVEFTAEIEETWSAEVKRRLEEFDRGQMSGLPAEQVFARVRHVLGQ
jgi:putative addiction module component (TIGR02574 family)